MIKTIMILLVFCTTLYTTKVNAQEIGKFYQLKVERQLQECDLEGNSGGFIRKLLPQGSKFTIVNKLNDAYVIKFWNWGTGPEITAVTSTRQASATKNAMTFGPAADNAQQRKIESFNLFYDPASGSWQQRYFRIASGDLTVYAEEVESAWMPSVGVATLPFKARPLTGEFTKDISITGLGGFRHKGLFGFFPSTNWSTLLGVGIGSVTLDSANTGGTLKKSSDFAAISVSVGEVIEWKKLQIGLFIGWDKVRKSDVNNWRNQGNLWWGFGIGFSIFSESSPAKEGTNKK